MGEEIPRSKQAPTEREVRSRLAQLANSAGLLKGSLSERERVCGKPTCRCTKGHKHRSLYLVSTEDGQVRQLFIPREWEERVRAWAASYKRARDLLDSAAQACWERVKKRAR